MAQEPASPDGDERMREVVHELQNLLGAIITYAELARQSLPSGHPADADMTEIGQAARRAVALVGSLPSLGSSN